VTDNPTPVNDEDELNVFQFFELFPDEQTTIDHFEAQRWPDRVIYPRCKSDYTSPVKNRNKEEPQYRTTFRQGDIAPHFKLGATKLQVTWIFDPPGKVKASHPTQNTAMSD